MSERKPFPNTCTICCIDRPAVHFKFDIPRHMFRDVYPSLPDIANLFLCPNCFIVLADQGAFEIRPAGTIGSFLHKVEERRRATQIYRERHERQMKEIRQRISSHERQIRDLERRTQTILAFSPQQRRRPRNRNRTPEGSTEEDELGW